MTLAPVSAGRARRVAVTGPADTRAGPPDVPRPWPGAHTRVFPARPDQVRTARHFTADVLAGCPVADEAVLCVSELATNCVIHSAAAQWGGTFTVRVEARAGESVRLEVADEGGPWREPVPDDRLHGLGIVRELARESGVAGGRFTGWVVWARLDWPAPTGPPRLARPDWPAPTGLPRPGSGDRARHLCRPDAGLSSQPGLPARLVHPAYARRVAGCGLAAGCRLAAEPFTAMVLARRRR